MGEIQVGEYVRCKDGEIDYIKAKTSEVYILKTIHSDFLSVPIKNYEKFIVKHSKNIIDLIEVEDYVNGILITGKEGTLLYTDIKGIDNSGYHIPISQYGENIKNIVTKEQFKQVEYRIEEEQNG